MFNDRILDKCGMLIMIIRLWNFYHESLLKSQVSEEDFNCNQLSVSFSLYNFNNITEIKEEKKLSLFILFIFFFAQIKETNRIKL